MGGYMSFIWFTNAHGVIGIAKVETQHEGIKYYISAVSGLDVAIDEETVISWGARFPDSAGRALFGEAEELDKKKMGLYEQIIRGKK
jgi:hypothetical protein